MPRLRRALAWAVTAVVAVAGLSGCASAVTLQPAADARNVACAKLVVTVPDSVSQLPERQTDAQGTAAWGDPAGVLLRCGVPVPDATATLPCIEVAGVDWLRDDSNAEDDVYSFITFGRDPAVEVIVHNESANGLSTLDDLADAVGALPTNGRKCISAQDAEPSATSSATPSPAG